MRARVRGDPEWQQGAAALWRALLTCMRHYSMRFAAATTASWLKTASLCARSAAVAFATALSATSVLSAASKSRTCGAGRIVHRFGFRFAGRWD